MARKCFVSFKTEDLAYKKALQAGLLDQIVDKSLDEAIDSYDENYILAAIRAGYLADSTVTIHLIGAASAETRGWHEQRFIKRELQASLYDGTGNTRNGILGIVLPNMYNSVYLGERRCGICGYSHNIIAIDDSTTVREFSRNYYIPNGRCTHTEEDRYCVLTWWREFWNSPARYIETAFAKRECPIARKVRVYPE